MKRMLYAAAAALLLVPAIAFAMSQSSVPPKFPIPWGSSAGSAYIRAIPQASQIGVQNCAASLTDGFPPLTFIPSSGGGCPPFGQDFNGILKQVTQWSQWQGAGASPLYDSGFSSSIGGYPSGATLANASTPGCYWVSTTDNNASDPDTGGSNWNSSCPGGGVGSTSTGSANLQVVAATPFVLRAGATISYIAGFSNSGPLQVNANSTGAKNVFRRSQLGATMSVGGEVIAGQLVTLQYDGTQYQCLSCAVAEIGEEKTFTGTTVPVGWLIENGTCVSQTTYSDLYAVYGSTDLWSPGSSCSAGNFHVPFANGRTAVAYDTQGSVTAGVLTNAGSGCPATSVAVVCGAQNRAITITYLPNITLTSNLFSLNTPDFIQSTNLSATGSQTYTQGLQNTYTQGLHTQGQTITTPLGGSGTAFPTVPPTYTVIKAVRY